MWVWILLVLLVVLASTLFWEFYWVPSRPRKFVDLDVGMRFSFLLITDQALAQVYVVLGTSGNGLIQEAEKYDVGSEDGISCACWSADRLYALFVKVRR